MKEFVIVFLFVVSNRSDQTRSSGIKREKERKHSRCVDFGLDDGREHKIRWGKHETNPERNGFVEVLQNRRSCSVLDRPFEHVSDPVERIDAMRDVELESQTRENLRFVCNHRPLDPCLFPFRSDCEIVCGLAVDTKWTEERE